jgi:hypothetical protein
MKCVNKYSYLPVLGKDRFQSIIRRNACSDVDLHMQLSAGANHLLGRVLAREERERERDAETEVRKGADPLLRGYSEISSLPSLL